MELRSTHILVECPELIASVRVGVLNALAPLEKDGVCQVRFRETRNVRKDDLAWCDIFVCVRGSESVSMRIAKEAKRLGRFLLYFLDDDLLHLPPESLAYAYFEYGNHQAALKRLLSISDGLWGANDLIRDDYLPLCGTDRWICTRMPTRVLLPAEREAASVVRVLYAGSVDHQNIIREILSPAVTMVTERCGSLIEFTFVGPDPNLKGNPQVRHQPFFEDYDSYRAFVSQGSFHIGLAPTKLERFFQCKYYNKFVEYTAIGAAGIYTDCPLYQQVVKHGENGLLCENDPQAWAEAIIQLATQPRLRQGCHESAAELIGTQFRPEQVAEQLLIQVPEIRDYRAPVVSAHQVRLRSLRFYFYWDRICYLFHEYHVFAVPVIGWKAIKKLGKWLLGR